MTCDRCSQNPTLSNRRRPSALNQCDRSAPARHKHCANTARGFTLIELVIVVAIVFVMMAIAIPLAMSAMRQFALKSAVASLTGAIQSTRYQAVFQGCQYRLTITAATYNYKIANEVPAAAGQPCLAAFGADGNSIPLAGSNVALNNNLTLVFHPSGLVQATTGTLTNIVLTQQNMPNSPETIQVSNYGRITVTP
jgi:prepilin-type N-terminal cleavage/methylation domain-containing protein